MDLPETRYAETTDGVSIAYQVVDDGPVDLVWIPGFVSHVEFGWTHPPLARLYRRIASFSRLILFDKRGTGLSDRVAPNYVPDLETRMIDVQAVMDATDSERAVILGLSEGGPMAMLFAATYPERTIALVAFGETPRYAWAPDFPWGETDEELERFIAEDRARWGTNDWAADELRSWAGRSKADDPVEVAFFATLARMGASPGAGETLWRMNHQIDVRAILPSIHVPTLEIAREGDPVPPPDGYTAKRIPGCRHVTLPGDDHFPWQGDAEALIAEIERFIRSVHDDEAELSRVLCTVLFTDIVDSTAQAAAMGDRRWREVADDHDRILRGQIARYHGREVKTMGDGFLATFDGPARAIRAATASAEAVKRLGIEIRAGLHTGECERIGEDVGGIAVAIGARVGAKARPSEVLVSQTVKDLVAGSGLIFEDGGEHELKGVPDRWRLYRVINN
ncbi:MAG TPA: adenylate/guanylate cyclase domain-containing protein [Actinomycetota bacterium]|nr:adenylate/guanylate cyclase domain-containing protein [Actinomycetota bacterium]